MSSPRTDAPAPIDKVKLAWVEKLGELTNTAPLRATSPIGASDLAVLDDLDLFEDDSAPTPPPAPTTKRAPPPSVKVKAGPTGTFVAVQKANLEWQGIRDDAIRQVDAVAQALAGKYPEEEALVEGVEEALKLFDGTLYDTVVSVAEVGGSERNRRCAASTQLIDTYVTYLITDPFVVHIEANPFQPVSFRADLLKKLASLKTALDQYVASHS